MNGSLEEVMGWKEFFKFSPGKIIESIIYSLLVWFGMFIVYAGSVSCGPCPEFIPNCCAGVYSNYGKFFGRSLMDFLPIAIPVLLGFYLLVCSRKYIFKKIFN